MSFKFSKAVKRVGGGGTRVDNSDPRIKATTTQSRFDLNPNAVKLLGLEDKDYVNILMSEEGDAANAFAICKVGDDFPQSAQVSVSKAGRGIFHFSGRYANIIGQNTDEDYSIQNLIEEGIATKKENGNLDIAYNMVGAISDSPETMEISEEDAEEMGFPAGEYKVYPIVNFEQLDKMVRDDDDDEEGTDNDPDNEEKVQF
jgi:hypothetical protein